MLEAYRRHGRDAHATACRSGLSVLDHSRTSVAPGRQDGGLVLNSVACCHSPDTIRSARCRRPGPNTQVTRSGRVNKTSRGGVEVAHARAGDSAIGVECASGSRDDESTAADPPAVADNVRVPADARAGRPDVRSPTTADRGRCRSPSPETHEGAVSLLDLFNGWGHTHGDSGGNQGAYGSQECVSFRHSAINDCLVDVSRACEVAEIEIGVARTARESRPIDCDLSHRRHGHSV